MSDVYTNWTGATVNPYDAIAGLMSCLNAGKNAWIERRQNGDQAFPVTKKNPELDNPFNWTMMYGTPRSDKALAEHEYFNETDRDLTYNWVACYGNSEAIEKYQTDGTVTDGLLFGESGICCPVRIEDADRYRKEVRGDGYAYGYWTTWWKPKGDIPYRVVDKDVGDVFVICYDDGPFDMKKAVRQAADFMKSYAESL